MFENTKLKSKFSQGSVLSLSSVALFIGGFFAPPMGVIDGSIIKACGILLGFYTVTMLPDIIRDKTLKVNHGNTQVTICKENQEEE